jgi:hypothetical protein
VAVEAGGGDGLGKHDADGDEDGAGAGSVGDGDFDAGAFEVLIATAEAEAVFGEIFADGDFFLKAAVADASEDASFDARALAPGIYRRVEEEKRTGLRTRHYKITVASRGDA